METFASLVRNLANYDMLAPERRDGLVPLSKLDEFMDYLVANGQGIPGVPVTTTTAMRVATVWRCVSLRASSIAQLPLIPFYMDADGDKEKARDHYLYRPLRYRWNPYLTAFRAKKLMQTWLDLHGNAYALLDISGRGQVTALWPWHPAHVEVIWDAGEPFYVYRFDDGTKTRPQPWFGMLHLRGISTDGFSGLSPIAEHRATVGYSLSLREQGNRMFANGATMRGYIQAPAGKTEKELLAAREVWQKTQAGIENSGKVAILANGLEYKPYQMSMIDAQWIEAQNLSVVDICRIFGVQPHKAFDLTRSTFSNIEHQDIEWRTDSLGDMVCNWEDELNQTLLSDRESQSVTIEFLINAMMRTDAAARAAYYSKALAGAPWMVQDEVRHAESLNSMGGDAKKFPVTNNAPGRAEAPKSQPPEPPAQEGNNAQGD